MKKKGKRNKKKTIDARFTFSIARRGERRGSSSRYRVVYWVFFLFPFYLSVFLSFSLFFFFRSVVLALRFGYLVFALLYLVFVLLSESCSTASRTTCFGYLVLPSFFIVSVQTMSCEAVVVVVVVLFCTSGSGLPSDAAMLPNFVCFFFSKNEKGETKDEGR